ncbi:unnamed protein product [Caretta caretta]
MATPHTKCQLKSIVLPKFVSIGESHSKSTDLIIQSLKRTTHGPKTQSCVMETAVRLNQRSLQEEFWDCSWWEIIHYPKLWSDEPVKHRKPSENCELQDDVTAFFHAEDTPPGKGTPVIRNNWTSLLEREWENDMLHLTKKKKKKERKTFLSEIQPL